MDWIGLNGWMEFFSTPYWMTTLCTNTNWEQIATSSTKLGQKGAMLE
jgi:hypothetical protein